MFEMFESFFDFIAKMKLATDSKMEDVGRAWLNFESFTEIHQNEIVICVILLLVIIACLQCVQQHKSIRKELEAAPTREGEAKKEDSG